MLRDFAACPAQPEVIIYDNIDSFFAGMRGLQATEAIRQGSQVMLFPFARAIKIDNNQATSPLPKLIPDHVWEAHFW